MTRSAKSTDLQDVLQELVESCDQPDRVAVEEIIRRYPRYAVEIADFASEWLLQELLPAAESPKVSPTAVSQAADAERSQQLVQRAMAQLTAQLPVATVASSPAAAAVAPSSQASSQASSHPFAGKTPAELIAAAKSLGLDKTVMAKLRDRRIEAASIPAALSRGLSEALRVPLAALRAHFEGPPLVAGGVNFKADRKPQAMAKESFGKAIRRSSMDAEQQSRWAASNEAKSDEAERSDP